jgi:DnaJ-class molecular chaperone
VRDYYAVLGIPRTANTAEVDAAFRRLARRSHPDMRPNEHAATALFKLAVEAYEVLSDVDRRRQYDRATRRRTIVAVSTAPPRASRPDLRPAASRSAPQAELRLVLEEARHGGPVELRIAIPLTCPACRDGWNEPCTFCDGRGFVVRPRIVRVHVPSGVSDGAVLRVPLSRDEADELRLVVRVRPCW